MVILDLRGASCVVVPQYQPHTAHSLDLSYAAAFTSSLPDPGAAEVMNGIPPDRLSRRALQQYGYFLAPPELRRSKRISGIPANSIALACIGDGRQSRQSGSSIILNASPEAATSGMLGCLEDGNVVRIDLAQHRADARSGRRKSEKGNGPFQVPAEPDAVTGDLRERSERAKRGDGFERGSQVPAGCEDVWCVQKDH